MEKVKQGWGKMAVLGLQHMFAMFGATIVVPALTGLDPAVALCAGRRRNAIISLHNQA